MTFDHKSWPDLMPGLGWSGSRKSCFIHALATFNSMNDNAIKKFYTMISSADDNIKLCIDELHGLKKIS